MTVVGLLYHVSVRPTEMAFVVGAMIMAGSCVCILLTPALIAATGQKDPREVVADELAGQAVCYLGVLLFPLDPITPGRMWIIVVAGFFLFRVFDIIKPWPARQLESLPEGWGILADDLMAGLYAGICLRIGVWLAT